MRTVEDQTELLEDAARQVSRRGINKFTRFLDPAQAGQAEQIARNHRVAFSVWGGFEQAERVIGCFHPVGKEVDPFEYPIVCLHSSVPIRFGSLTHRDLLGAFMALGLTRSCIGDMIISGSDVYLFAFSQVADFIASSMTSAGKMHLDFRVMDDVPAMPDPDGTEFRSVVSSLRLDAVLAAAYHLSRSEAAEYIRAGLVKVEHLPCERVDFMVKEGSLLSLRGHGRVKLREVGGMTRKQRIGITLFRYE